MRLFLIKLLFLLSLFCITLVEEIEDCQELNKISYDKCASKRNCNICALSIYCSWCFASKQCLPINSQTQKSVCLETCDEFLSLDKCFKSYYHLHNEEIDLTYSNYNKPQFKPNKYEKEYYSYEFDNEGSKLEGGSNRNKTKKRKIVFKENERLFPKTLQSAKSNILTFFDKLLKKK